MKSISEIGIVCGPGQPGGGALCVGKVIVSHVDPENEIQAIAELKAMDRQSLDAVPFDVVHWRCCVKLCHHFTRGRDYGILEDFYHPRFGWIDPRRQFYLCSKHNKAFNTRWNKDQHRIPFRHQYWNDHLIIIGTIKHS